MFGGIQEQGSKGTAMYTLILMTTLAASSADHHILGGHYIGNGYHAYSGYYYEFNGDGGDWYPTVSWYGGGARGVAAWAAYGATINGANLHNGSALGYEPMPILGNIYLPSPIVLPPAAAPYPVLPNALMR